ncbi:Beta-barrel assembly machine subunit BamE [Azomonas agilis]|uniref:Outer membrane protein assembly factor BamE n=1 Tax=Azomonas agilis TaxID=116849 RepID=A0A562J2H7_9GAMM|nr:outer membrane protein assembly factor BamE [Azomonas agilis]TWH77406.1 Beta-barrel assembly machine subunit BamE [Azomonas agilis]
MQNSKLLLTCLICFNLLAGCAIPIPHVYKMDIQQGNVITQDMVDQLRPGMTQRQVRFIMGSPLMTDTFHPKRWDYLYSFQAGGTRRQQERISLVFGKDNQLIGLAGDFMPGVSRDQRLLGTGQATTIVNEREGQQPVQQDEAPEPGSLLDELQREIDAIEPAPVPVPERL